MTSLSTVLRGILNEDAAGATGPLYRYRLTAGLLARLGALVERRRGGDWDREEAAAVALYGAHRLCREHREGPWRWETSLGFEPTPIQRERLLDALTHFWRRPLLHSGRGREVLWSLGREGGLPHHLLVDEGDGLGRVLRAVLRDRERLPSVVGTGDLVEDHALRLSPRYRVEGMREVLVDLVDAVAALRRQVGDNANPVATLDRNNPYWRDALPLLFDQGHADRLVLGLLTAPQGRAEESPFVFEVRLVRVGAAFRVVRRIAELPSQVASALLKTIFNKEPPHQGRLLVVDQRGSEFPLGDLNLVGDGTRFSVRRLRTMDLPLTENLSLRVRGPRGLVVECGSVPGAEGLCLDEPWIFSERGDLLGTGSVTVRDPALFAVWPTGWSASPAPSPHGSEILGVSAADRSVWLVSERTEVCPPGENVPFELCPGVAKPPTLWSLDDRCFKVLAGIGTRVLVGTPTVYRKIGEGAQEKLGSRIEYAHLHDRGAWAGLDASVCGEIWLRVRDGARVVLRRRALRVPDDFNIILSSDEVQVHSRSRALRTLVVCSREDLDVSLTPNLGRVGIPQATNLPAMLRLRVSLNGVRDFEIEVPNPQRRSAFVGPGGMRATEPVAVDRLLGLRAEVWSGVDNGQRWRVEGRAWRNDGEGTSRGLAAGWINLGELRRVDERRQVLELSDLESDLRLLLAQAERLDAEVELGLVAYGARRPVQILCVKQYPRVLLVSRDEGEGEGRPVPYLIALEDGDETPLKVRVQPIGEPGHPGYEAEVAEGGWVWPEAAGHDGAWLVTALEGEVAEPVPGARPRRITIRGVAPGPPAPTEGLAAAVAARSETRAWALGDAFDVMAQDAAHEDWLLLDAHLDTLSRWPATTYDVVVQLAKHPRALALAVLRRAWMGKLAGIAEAFETLPFAWWQVPATAWKSAFRILEACIDRLQRAHFSQEPAWWIDELRKTCRHLDGAGCLLGKLPSFFNPDPGTPPPVMVRLKGAHEGLLRRRTEHDWPGLGPRGALAELLAAIEMPSARLWDDLPRADRSPDGRLKDHRDEMRAAPLIAAWITAHGRSDRLSLEQLMTLRRARAFDPEWFEAAWGIAFPAYCSALEATR